MTKPLIAIVGRPNVGKSALFNRLVGQRLAIVSDTAGTTRDRLYADTDFAGREFTVIDTGGLEMDLRMDLPGTPASMLESVRAQAQLAMDEADAIIFLVDIEQGPSPNDFEVAKLLRGSSKPIYLVANKADNESRRLDVVEFYQLGIGDPIPISAFHGIGIGDLLDRIIEKLPEEIEDKRDIPRLAIVGKPNVGKSSLLNAILGEERAIVSEIPGTTRDATDTEMLWSGQPVILIDTAGLRRRGHIEPGIEKYSSLRALRAIQRADVALLVIDAVEGITSQDEHIAGYILEAGRGVAIVVNKWDLLEKSTGTMDEYTERVRGNLDFIAYAPILYVSAKTHQRVNQLVEAGLAARASWKTRVPDEEINEMLREATTKHTPAGRGKRLLKFYQAAQTGIAPPTFVFYVNNKKLVHFTYERFLENQLRERWRFEGTPVRLNFRNRSKGN